jgi:hypothetical protein
VIAVIVAVFVLILAGMLHRIRQRRRRARAERFRKAMD